MSRVAAARPAAKRRADAARRKVMAAKFVAQGLCRCGKEREPGFKACPGCRASQRAYQRKVYRRHLPAKKTFGICHANHCNQEKVPGYDACGYHLEKRAEWQAARRQARLEMGKCTKCDKTPEPGRKLCPHHAEQQRRATKKYKDRKRLLKPRKGAA